MSPLEFFALVGAGALIGIYATAVGAGGGFLLAPLLLLRYTDADPPEVTMAALSVVAVSSGLTTVFSARERRIDYAVSGLLLVTALPAALIGALGTTLLPRAAFAGFFAALLLIIGLFLIVRPSAPIGAPGTRGWRRHHTDADGSTFYYLFPVRRSIGVTSVAALLASLAGIGGGLIYTPLTTHVMRMPHWLAVPTAHVLITGIAVMVVIFQLAAGNFADPMQDVPALALGVIPASRFSSRLQRRLGAGLLTRFLAIGLLVIGIRTALIAT